MTQARTGVRKRMLGDSADVAVASHPGEIDLSTQAAVAYTSEDPAHPVENMLDGIGGPGAARWLSGRADTTEQIVFEFDHPQDISRLAYEVEETDRERTQQVRIEVSTDGGASYRQILAQDYTFSPNGATFQREDLRFEIHGASHLRLTVVPNKNGSGTATVTSLRLFA